ncbi:MULTISPECIES: hypothetical protein [Cellulomonas]|uniref:Uncharacterized protein n=1 Tax=Cellulomonas iranensis TaxID=76862 RepID=A0ABU0GFD4_9CELL|nr:MULTISPECIES: hypothetical protein [Cellulomonas]MDQ0424067.1 hypothetical protein [Cellulomonas iranensis]
MTRRDDAARLVRGASVGARRHARDLPVAPPVVGAGGRAVVPARPVVRGGTPPGPV